MLLRQALLQELDAISALMRLSKAHWGYSPEQIEKWHDELTVSVDYLHKHHVCIAIEESELFGMCSFRNSSEDNVQLDGLFVAPSKIGMGVGSALLGYCVDSAIQSGASAILLDADPNAKGFYYYHGFRIVGKKPSSIAGRCLPIMSKCLKIIISS